MPPQKKIINTIPQAAFESLGLLEVMRREIAKALSKTPRVPPAPGQNQEILRTITPIIKKAKACPNGKNGNTTIVIAIAAIIATRAAVLTPRFNHEITTGEVRDCLRPRTICKMHPEAKTPYSGRYIQGGISGVGGMGTIENLVTSKRQYNNPRMPAGAGASMENRPIMSGMPPYRRICPVLASNVENANERGLYQYHEAKAIAAVAAIRQA